MALDFSEAVERKPRRGYGCTKEQQWNQ